MKQSIIPKREYSHQTMTQSKAMGARLEPPASGLSFVDKALSNRTTIQPMFRRGLGWAGAMGAAWVGRNIHQQNAALQHPDQIDPNGRLGAMLAARRFEPHQVGAGVFPAIRAIHAVFGNIGEQQIGRLFNGPQAQALMGQPRNQANHQQLGAMEHQYWQDERGRGANPLDEFMIQFGANVNPQMRGHIQEMFARMRDRH